MTRDQIKSAIIELLGKQSVLVWHDRRGAVELDLKDGKIDRDDATVEALTSLVVELSLAQAQPPELNEEAELYP